MKDGKDLSVSRRRFFAKLLAGGIEQFEQAGHAMARQVEQMTGRGNPHRRYLRPPGALPEADFLSACTRCGDCVRACPVQCIRVDEAVAGGYPYIEARRSPCVICQGLDCTHACPEGALQTLVSASLIEMGAACADHVQCLRTTRQPVAEEQRNCQLCVNQCPIGVAALGIDQAGRIDVRDGCTGCGVCEHVCPTEPAAVRVMPRRF